MANNRTTRRVYGNADLNNSTPLPAPMPTGGVEVDAGFYGPVQMLPTGNVPLPTSPSPSMQQQFPTGQPTVQTPTNTPPSFGYYGGMGYTRNPDGTYTRVPHAQPRRDRTGSLLGTGMGLVAGAAGAGPLGLLARPAGNWLSRLIRESRIKRNAPKDTLTRDQIAGRNTTAQPQGEQPLRAQPVNNPNYAQQAGINLGRGMEGTYLDRTTPSAGQFAANQRGNQLWNDTRSGAPNFGQPDEINRLNRPIGNGRLAYNPGYSTTREAMDMRNGPVTAFRQPQEELPQVNMTAGGMEWVGDPTTAVQGPVQYPAAGGTTMADRLALARQRIRDRTRLGGRMG